MRAIFFRLVLVSAMSAVAPLAHPQLLTHRDLSYSMAKTIAETAIDSCAAKGYAVSAVVVDRAGDVIVAMRADNAGPHTMENARRKAYTARSFRTSTAAYAKRFADNDRREATRRGGPQLALPSSDWGCSPRRKFST